MTPICVPDDWDGNGLMTFEEFCVFVRTPQRTVRDWRQRDVGPRWTKLAGAGRLYIRVSEVRLYLNNGLPRSRNGRSGNKDTEGTGAN